MARSAYSVFCATLNMPLTRRSIDPDSVAHRAGPASLARHEPHAEPRQPDPAVRSADGAPPGTPGTGSSGAHVPPRPVRGRGRARPGQGRARPDRQRVPADQGRGRHGRGDRPHHPRGARRGGPAGRRDRRDRLGVERPDGRRRGRGRRGGPPGRRDPPPARGVRRQGRRAVEVAVRAEGRPDLLHRRGHPGVRRAVRPGAPRPAAARGRGAVHQGVLRAPDPAGRRPRPHRRRPGDRADGPAAGEPVPPRARGGDPAALGRVRGDARAARVRAVPVGVRRGARPAGRHRR